MGCIVSTVKLSCAQVVMKTWENTHWELLKPLYKQWSLYYYTYYNRISFSKISHTLPPIILIPHRQVQYPTPSHEYIPRYISRRPITPVSSTTTTHSSKCENGVCTNDSVCSIVITLETNTLRSRVCSECKSFKMEQMKWDLRCYRSSHSN